MIDIRNEDCFVTMKNMSTNVVDVILTSPPYNTNKKAGKTRTLKNTTVKDEQYNYVRYDSFVDSFTDEEYTDFTKRLFVSFDRILKPNGCILYNINYGAENTEGMFRAVYSVINETPFTIADVIVWKKPTALPNSCSPNRLTRIWEFIFVFCRRTEMKTFSCNKRITSYRKTGQAEYENIFNFIEAKNNDGSCPYNKATYSSELCEKLLSIYAKEGSVVYDPFIGSGTTAVACKNMGFDCIGSELSSNQCQYSVDRVGIENVGTVEKKEAKKERRHEKKTTIEEKVQIVKDCIESGNDYIGISKKYGVSYFQVSNWTKKYIEFGVDSLLEKRGRKKKVSN